MIPKPATRPASGYWVVGGRFAADGHLPWPRAFGPFDDHAAARACAEHLADPARPDVRYVVVADAVAYEAGSPA